MGMEFEHNPIVAKGPARVEGKVRRGIVMECKTNKMFIMSMGRAGSGL